MSALGQKQTSALQTAMLLYPQEQTYAVQKGMSAMGQKRTSRRTRLAAPVLTAATGSHFAAAPSQSIPVISKQLGIRAAAVTLQALPALLGILSRNKAPQGQSS